MCTAYTATIAATIGGALGGFSSGLILSNGDFKAGLQGALTGGAFGVVSDFGAATSAERIAAHGAVGCASAAIGGKGCGPGALSAAAAKFATGQLDGYKGLGDIGKGVAATVVGGTASVIAGGKFENGALTAAYGYLFNSLAHPKDTLEAGIRQAMLRGDAAELRLLLGEANLSASDLAIAQRALSVMQNLGAQEARMLAERYGIDFANKIGHAFGKEMHNLGGLVRHFGSAERAFVQIQTRIDSLALPAGRFEQSLNIGGSNITVRGFVQDGAAKIGTIFKP